MTLFVNRICLKPQPDRAGRQSPNCNTHDAGLVFPITSLFCCPPSTITSRVLLISAAALCLQEATKQRVLGHYKPRAWPVQLLLVACVVCSGGLLLALAALLPPRWRLTLSHRRCPAYHATRLLVQVGVRCTACSGRKIGVYDACSAMNKICALQGCVHGIRPQTGAGRLTAMMPCSTDTSVQTAYMHRPRMVSVRVLHIKHGLTGEEGVGEEKDHTRGSWCRRSLKSVQSVTNAAVRSVLGVLWDLPSQTGMRGGVPPCGDMADTSQLRLADMRYGNILYYSEEVQAWLPLPSSPPTLPQVLVANAQALALHCNVILTPNAARAQLREVYGGNKMKMPPGYVAWRVLVDMTHPAYLVPVFAVIVW